MVQKEERKLVGMNVNLDGEILQKVYEGDYFVSKEQMDARKEYIDYKDRAKYNRWIGCHHDNIKDISDTLNLTNAGAIMKLLPYMKFNSNGLLFYDGSEMDKKEIEFILNRSARGTINILNELIKANILIVKKKGRFNTYHVNSKYHTFGKMLEDQSEFTKVFISKIKESGKLLKLNELGLLYKIIPFFHYEYFSLCSNPNENDITKIDYISKDQLALLVGCTTRNIHDITKKLQSNYLMMTVKSGKHTHYVIHPDLMYRKLMNGGTYTETVKQFKRLKEAKSN